jgi:hypothetical protein
MRVGGLSSAAALFIIIIAVNVGKSPASPGNGTTAGLTASASAAATGTSVQRAAQPAATTQAAPATQTAAAASSPAASTPAAAVVPPASAGPASCTPLTDAGNCYEPGEYCRGDDHGASGVAGNGEAITCEDNDGWRWEPA